LRHQLIGSLQAAEPERDPRPFCFSKGQVSKTKSRKAGSHEDQMTKQPRSR